MKERILMKKLSLFMVICFLIAGFGCKMPWESTTNNDTGNTGNPADLGDPETPEDSESKELTANDKKAIISKIFTAGMNGYSSSMLSGKSIIGGRDAAKRILRSAQNFYETVDVTVPGPEGGTIKVAGICSGSMTFNDTTCEVISGNISFNMTETITDYKITVDGQQFTINGDPSISLKGIFTLAPQNNSGNIFGTPTNMIISGGMRIAGPSFNDTFKIDMTITMNSQGTGGTVSGKIDDEKIDYTI